MATKNGHAPLITSFILTSAIFMVVNRQKPKGGVTKPIWDIITAMMQKCIASMPKNSSTGLIMGPRIRTTVATLVKHPTTKNRTQSSNQSKYLLWQKPMIQSYTRPGIPCVVIHQTKTCAVAMVIVSVAALTVEAFMMLYSSLKETVRYTKSSTANT